MEENKQEEENKPDQPLIAIPMDGSEPLTVDSTLEDAKKSDLPIMNAVVAFTYASWVKVASIDSLCKMVKATNEAIEGRRKVLGLPYGYQTENQPPQGKAASKFFSSIK